MSQEKEYKYIKNNLGNIKRLFEDYLKMEINDMNISPTSERGMDDLMICFRHNGRTLRLVYSEKKDKYVLNHVNNCSFNKNSNKEHVHVQGSKNSLIAIIRFAETLHQPKSMNRKSNSMFEKLKNTTYKDHTA